MSFANIYTHRKVAETNAKGCEVCYRPTSSVLVAPENKVRSTYTYAFADEGGRSST